MPDDSVFIDANVLLYARDEPAGEKPAAAAAWARRLAALRQGCTNLHVLNEVTNVLLRKRQKLSPQQIFDEVDGLQFFGTAPITEPIVLSARRVRISTRYSWDCLLLASALEMRCTHFLSEDMSGGQRVSDGSTRSLTIINPFAHSPDHILSR